ncbi:MAG: hypothetical protein ACTSYQ_03575 [Candidatus Odinarchaeia archaeon]
MKYWVIDKNDLSITGPMKSVDHISNMDFHLVVIKDWYDVKAQFTPTEKEDLFFQLKNSRNYPLNTDQSIFWALPGNKKPRAARRATESATLDEVYRQAAEVLGEPEKALRDRYAHLGAGLQSMNLRNRMKKYG